VKRLGRAYGPEVLMLAAGLAWSIAALSVSPLHGVVSLLVVTGVGVWLIRDRRRAQRRQQRAEVWARRNREARMRDQLLEGRWS
jgi:Flp pilus assembly protein TadB